MAVRRTVSRTNTTVLKSFLSGLLFGGVFLLILVGGWAAVSASAEVVGGGSVGMVTGIARLWQGVRFWTTNLFRTEEVAQEARQLHKKVARLEAENTQLRRYAEENKRLRALLQLSQTFTQPYIAAEVIALGGSNWYHTAIINKGSREGTVNGAPVLNHQGLVGRIWEVRSHHSVLLLLTDRRSAIGVTLSRHPKVHGIVKGTGGQWCELVHLSRKVIPPIGEPLVTSGLGGVFPKGIPVGTVAWVQRQTDPPTVWVRPFLTQQELREVIVLTELPPLPQPP